MANHHSITETPHLWLARDDEPLSSGAETVPNIAKLYRKEIVRGAAIVSACLSTVAVWSQHECVVWLGPGILFGLLVLLPWCRFCEIGWWDTVAAVGLAPLGYAAAVYLTINFNGFTLFAGLAGSAIMLVPLMVRGHPRVRSEVWIALGAGWWVGWVSAVPILACLGGVALWQICVAYSLSTALEKEDT